MLTCSEPTPFLTKIIDYKCVSESGDFKEFNESVNNLIRDGYQPLGGVSTTIDNQAVYFARAMVRYDDGIERVHVG
jgi:hypothetical protein